MKSMLAQFIEEDALSEEEMKELRQMLEKKVSDVHYKENSSPVAGRAVFIVQFFDGQAVPLHLQC